MMKLETFEMERIQSEWEHLVKFNLTESGFEPVTLRNLLTDEHLLSTFLDMKIGYSQTNGTIPLRDLISEPYSGATADNVLVTNGGAEANFLAVWRFLHESTSGNELAMMLPNYMQMHGVWRALGGKVNPFHLTINDGEWILDMEELKNAVSKDTIAIAICNPNNPTGTVLSAEQLRAIADIAQDARVPVISDEIYQGAENEGDLTPSMFDYYDSVLVTSSLSKVFGLPGLRLGWIVCSKPEIAKELWMYSDYTTICPSKLSDWLATIALQPETRKKLQTRGTKHVHSNWNILKEWLDSYDFFEYVAPKAGAFCFLKYDLNIDSLSLVTRLLEEKSVLIVPGVHFGMENHLRIGFGYSESNLRNGLALIGELLDTLH
ncbi:MAG: aminotransferase class I/II-fold pyridoxal phosphate-dependent enzyme [Candidatus Thorarchaeota archaeon]